MPYFGEVIRAREPTRLRVVMTRAAVKAVLANLSGGKWLMASLVYGLHCASRFLTSRCSRSPAPVEHCRWVAQAIM